MDPMFRSCFCVLSCVLRCHLAEVGFAKFSSYRTYTYFKRHQNKYFLIIMHLCQNKYFSGIVLIIRFVKSAISSAVIY